MTLVASVAVGGACMTILLIGEPRGATAGFLALAVTWFAIQVPVCVTRLLLAPRQVSGRLGSLYLLRTGERAFLFTPPGIDLLRSVPLDRIRPGFTIGARRGRAVIVAPWGSRLLEFVVALHPSDVARLIDGLVRTSPQR
ncbi:hypothetical protein [Demequina zhanjiangensis]|uniref:PH domain-containing protein n=1 Tax=Demequina zhanjiangensis TaxID=3051659 RepID=A0ABT8FZ72_9MICO|nr:hypothetical protein [Demequina sp. SYSU T00b26]MDN4472113.1 hypothetical protein [Demequina sp. SYSU T00b26]